VRPRAVSCYLLAAASRPQRQNAPPHPLVFGDGAARVPGLVLLASVPSATVSSGVSSSQDTVSLLRLRARAHLRHERRRGPLALVPDRVDMVLLRSRLHQLRLRPPRRR
jgi:hypothetical protein